MDFIPVLILSTIISSANSDPNICLNSGILSEGSCICPPEFTGPMCETFLVFGPEFSAKIETTFHKIVRRSTDECFGLQSGSGSGSGMGEDSIPECSGDKQLINDRCQFPRMFLGNIKLTGNKRNFSMVLKDRNSDEFKDFQKEVDCLMEKLFQEVTEYGGVSVTSIQPNSTNFDFKIFFNEESKLESSELQKMMVNKSRGLELNQIESVTITDVDECKMSPCDADHAECRNVDGSFECECKTGFTNNASSDRRSGSECRDVCEDSEGETYCLNGGTCLKTANGTGVCTCPDYYQGVRCELKWYVFMEATIGLGAALGGLLVIFVTVTIMLCEINRAQRSRAKSDFVELESNSLNGDFHPTNESTELKGISNPYVSSDEGITVATNQADDDAPDEEDDRL